MKLKEELIEIVTALNDEEIEYALCGGLAVAIHGYPRATRNIDFLTVENELDHAEEALRKLGYIYASGVIVLDPGTRKERKVLRISKFDEGDTLTIDFIIVPSFLRDVWEDREKYLLDDLEIQVVSKSGLAKMKRIAGRPQDISDISELAWDLHHEFG